MNIPDTLPSTPKDALDKAAHHLQAALVFLDEDPATAAESARAAAAYIAYADDLRDAARERGIIRLFDAIRDQAIADTHERLRQEGEAA